jgi:hypothetical protein
MEGYPASPKVDGKWPRMLALSTRRALDVKLLNRTRKIFGRIGTAGGSALLNYRTLGDGGIIAAPGDN